MMLKVLRKPIISGLALALLLPIGSNAASAATETKIALEVPSISERYDISIQQIVRVNDFHADQDVYEGQILYIPAYSTSK